MPDFGELSKKLAEVWKQLPEKDKLVSTLSYEHVFELLYAHTKMCDSPIDTQPNNAENGEACDKTMESSLVEGDINTGWYKFILDEDLAAGTLSFLTSSNFLQQPYIWAKRWPNLSSD